MDSWKYVSEGKSVWFSDEVDFSVDDHNCKRKLVGCEIKPIHNVENYPLISNTQALERMDFMDLGFPDDIRKSYSISSEQSGEVFSDEIGTDYHPLFGEERESGSRICTEFMQSNKQDFSLVDLKLGSLADGGIGKGSELPKADVPESSIMLSSPAKKARPTLLSMRSHYCQVHGCSKDLSSCKSYYKRHKVCDVHTKTPKVIVDGIEQRFCQQCSRFHLLAEFDDIKRSCRRRLAAHNKRRRRPQLSSESGSGIIDFSLSQTFPGVMPSVFLSPNKYEDRCGDSIKSSNFFLEMGRVEEKMDKIAANVKGDIFELVKPKFDDECSIQQTNRALSLLSAQSHSISSQWLETASTPLINQNNQHADAEAGKTISMEADEEGPTAMNGDPVGLQLNPKGPGIILNLLQLSSHLQRLEHRRHSTQNEAG